MALTYNSEFIFIGRGDESFLENYSYEFDDDPDSKTGKIFMSLEILNNQAEAEDIGEAIFANFKQKFYENMEVDAYQRFEEALKAVNMTIDTLKEEKVSRFIGNLNAAIGVIVGGNLYISTTGDAEVYLVRRRFVSIISEGLAEESGRETFVNIANGNLEPFDRVILSSTRLLRYITKSELGKIFTEGGPAEISSQLANLQDFIMTEILGKSAIVGIAVGVQQTDPELENIFEEEKMGIFTAIKSLIAETPVFFKKLASKLSFLGKLPGLSKISETEEHLKKSFKLPKITLRRPMGRERILLAIAVLLIVLVGGTVWLRSSSSQRKVLQEQQSKLNHVRELVNDAMTTGQFDKPKASDLLGAAEKETLDVLSSKNLRGEAVKMLDEIQAQRDSLDDVKRITAPTLLADFSSKRNTASALGMLQLKDRIYGFEYNALYEIVLDRLQDPVTINDVETVILGATFPDKESLLFLTRTGKMIEYAASHFLFATTKDGIWKKGVDMETYSDRVYILDPERNQIWRYIRRKDTFDIAEAYNQNAELKNAVSLAIDASVYVLNSDGTVIQLYQGQKQDYPLRRPPLDPMEAPTKIYTNPDLGYIYILEPSKQRVLVFRKDQKNGGAQYHTQYIFEKTGTLRDVLVSDNRLYVMDDKKVYFVNLSGL